MCTVVILRRPGHDWPVIMAANRDEMSNRPWRPPARHWSDRPEVVAGIDLLAGGTWLGVNDHGVVAAVMNRRGSLGPDDRLRSRGELVLEALDHADAAAAAQALAGLDGRSYRSFNILVADNRDAYWLKSQGREADGSIKLFDVPAGVSMLTSHDRNDPESPRIRHHLPRFVRAKVPDPDAGDWTDWEALLASRDHDPAADGRDAMAIVTDAGFATVSSSLLALPAIGDNGRRPLWRFAPGLPGAAAFAPVDLAGP
jgi:uncharacterized protein with NRDE domain